MSTGSDQQCPELVPVEYKWDDPEVQRGYRVGYLNGWLRALWEMQEILLRCGASCYEDAYDHCCNHHDPLHGWAKGSCARADPPPTLGDFRREGRTESNV